MSTTRRRLGTGPDAPATTAPPAESFPRLLPVERIEPGPADGDQHQAVTDRTGRRTLGAGVVRAPEDPRTK